MFLTGEFSRIARVSKRSLQYYGEIGLLHPAHTDPHTGYRYYSAKQLPRLNRILAMKDLGLTLDQIRRMMDDEISLDEIHGMLLMQQAELENKLREDMQRFHRIKARLRDYQQDVKQLPDVVLKSVPKTEILVTRQRLTAESGWLVFGQIMQHLPAQVDMRQLGHMLLTTDANEFLTENIEVEFGFVVQGKVPEVVALTDELVLTKRVMPAVPQMATIAHIGHPQTASIPYGALGTWIESNGFGIAGFQRELFIDGLQTGNLEDLVMELQIPVERVDHNPLFPL